MENHFTTFVVLGTIITVGKEDVIESAEGGLNKNRVSVTKSFDSNLSSP